MMYFFLSCVISMAAAYLLGSCNSSIIVVRLLKGEDIRNHGSKNAGLTNTLRCFGKAAAVLTLIGDLLKGVIAVILARLIFGLFGFSGSDYAYLIKSVGYAAGFFAIIGHIFPLYYGFKGGKGVLTSSSILIVLDPLSFALAISCFLLAVAVTKYVSLSSMIAAVFYPILTFVLNYFFYKEPLNQSLTYTGLVALTSAMLIYMHRTNIARLRAGTEAKITDKKRVDKDNNS
ncbi:MAG: glycerol-3-phosphate 1-O-acyltransferase PlsY [Oscillospiraceae bacterium]|nr:glycerol-3-phosphate 1-O-acyltransferase PlsY [Oscillospiraceae bacterium]